VGDNIANILSMNEVPDKYRDFVKDKQLQLLNNLVTSAVIAVVATNSLAAAIFFYTDTAAFSLSSMAMVLLHTLQGLLPVAVLTLLATLFVVLTTEKVSEFE